MIYQGETVAFSTKSNVWKTRYSFNPTCYMDMDDDFLSSAPIDEEDTRLAWRHDISGAYNNFYETAYPSTIRVASNQNPSATKAFKSISLETNTQGWTARVQTNLDRGGDFTLTQDGTIRSFESKEGNQYASMPRNSQGPGNSTSNIVYVGLVRLGDLLFGIEEGDDLQDAIDATEALTQSYIEYEVPLQSVPAVPITPAQESKLYFASAGQGNFLTSIAATAVPQYNIYSVFSSQGYNEDAMSMVGYNGANNSIIFRSPYIETGLVTQVMNMNAIHDAIQGNIYGPAAQTPDFDLQIPIYMMTNPRINGDLMRGPYATIDLTLPYAGMAFELHSINVDYENTKLDGSLG